MIREMKEQDTAAGMAPPFYRTTLARDLGFIAVVAMAALVLRLFELADSPFGLHGDEAWNGLDARAILDGDSGIIWPYTGAALGQPSGPMFYTVPFEALMGPSVLAIRLPMALLGVATVVVGFFAMRELFGRPAAYAWAVLAASSSWLLFYHRTGFTVPFMPFTEMLSLLAVAVALKRRWWLWYVLAGFIVGAGIYGYYAYPLFAFGLAAYVLLHFLIERPKPGWLHARNVLVMGLMALLVVQPMWHYFTSKDIGWRHDRDVFALSGTPEYKATTSTNERIDLYFDNAVDMTRTLLWEGKADYSDGTGAKPALDWSVITLAAIGLPVSLWYAWTRRRAAYLLPWIIIPLILVGPISTLGGYHRRSLGSLVFVLMLASMTLSFVWETLERTSRRQAAIIGTAVFTVILGMSAAINVHKYFWNVRDSAPMHFTYAPELMVTARWVSQRPDDAHIYWFSNRWAVEYETTRYFLRGQPNRENRSEKFGEEGKKSVLPELNPDEASIIVLVDEYVTSLDAMAAQKYTTATRYQGQPVKDRPAFIAYVIEPQ